MLGVGLLAQGAEPLSECRARPGVRAKPRNCRYSWARSFSNSRAPRPSLNQSVLTPRLQRLRPGEGIGAADATPAAQAQLTVRVWRMAESMSAFESPKAQRASRGKKRAGSRKPSSPCRPSAARTRTWPSPSTAASLAAAPSPRRRAQTRRASACGRGAVGGARGRASRRRRPQTTGVAWAVRGDCTVLSRWR